MNKEEKKYALAEFMGYVWYRAPQDHHFPDEKYRFLALPEIQEYEGQIDIWKQRADGTEKIIDSKEWRKAQGVDYVPDYPEDLNAMREVENKLRENQFHFVEYPQVLFQVITGKKWDGDMGYFMFNFTNVSAEFKSEAACRVIYPERWT